VVAVLGGWLGGLRVTEFWISIALPAGADASLVEFKQVGANEVDD